MKSYKTILLMLLFMTSKVCLAQTKSVLKKDTANICILKLDYLTYKFEGGNISYYRRCSETDSLPFIVNIKLPGDVGRVLFTLNETNDTIFHASYVWAGRGKIKYPLSYLTDTPFQVGNSQIEKPKNPAYYDWLGFKSKENLDLIKRADSAWNTINNLDIIEKFSQYRFKVGIYRYHPQDGILDVTKAKWIIFLFNMDQTNMGLKPAKLNTSVYPNPCSTNLEINSIQKSSYLVYDLSGRIRLHGTVVNSKIDVMELADGIYVLEIKNNEGTSRIKFVKSNAR